MYLFSPPNNENGNLHISQAGPGSFGTCAAPDCWLPLCLHVCGIAQGSAIALSHRSLPRACLEFDLESMDTFGKADHIDLLRGSHIRGSIR